MKTTYIIVIKITAVARIISKRANKHNQDKYTQDIYTQDKYTEIKKNKNVTNLIGEKRERKHETVAEDATKEKVAQYRPGTALKKC